MHHDMTDQTVKRSPDSRHQTVFLPILSGIVLSLLVAGLWWTLEQREKANLRGKIRAEANYLASLVDADIRSRIPALERLVKRWEFRGGVPKDEFIHDAEDYFKDTPGYQAVEWVDKAYYVRWVVPLAGNEQTVNLNLAFEPKRRMTLEKARMTREPAMTPPIDLVQGGKGFLVYFPIHLAGESEGFILAAFRIEEWLTFVFNAEDHHSSSKDYRVMVQIDDLKAYTQEGWDDIAQTGLDAMASTRILDHDLSIHIRPTRDFIQKNKTLLPALTAGLGLLLSLLVTAVVYLFQKASLEKLSAQAAQTAMETEEKNLKAIFESSPVGMLVLDENTNIIMANGVAKSFSSDNDPDVAGRQPGDALNCIHRSEDPRGCGYSASCSLCSLRNAINSVIKNGSSLRQVEVPVDVVRSGQPETLWLAVGAEPFIILGRQLVVVALHDITDRKQSNAALKRSEEQVRLLLNSTGEAIYGIDLEGRCTFANPACLRMLGYDSVDHLLGKNMHALIHHSYPDGHFMPIEDCRIYKAFHNGKPEHREDEVLWKSDGSSFPVEYWSYPQIINGEIHGAVVTFVDITERKQVRDALQQRESYLTAIIENQPGLVWLKDTESRFLAVNQAFALSCGKQKPEELLGKTDQDVWPRDLAEKYRKDDLLTIKTGKPTIVEEPISDQGETRWFETFKTPVFNSRGGIIGTTGYARDITAQRKAQEALAEREINFRSFFETMTDMIMVGTPDARIIFTNKAFQKKLDYSPEELAVMNIWDVHPANDRKEAEEIFAAMYRGERESCPLPLVSKNGTVIPVETRVWSGRWNGKDCVFGISKDLSIEQEAQQRFERLFRNNPTLMALTVLPDQTFSDINSAFEKVLGYSRNEVIGKTFSELDLFVSKRQLATVTERIRAEGRILDVELMVRHKDGTIIHGLYSGEIISSYGRQYFLTVMVDITERKNAERLLSVERKRLASILEGTNAGTWEWNVQTGETVFNERWAEIIGYTLDEIAPVSIDTWMKFTHPEDLKVSNEILQKHFNKEIPYYETEARMRHKGGHFIWVLDRGKVASWTADGKPLMMSGTHQDITNRKHAETQLEQMNRTLQQRVEDTVAELREKDQVLIQQGRLASMGEMIGNIAHQWRQPLNALSMLITNLHYALREGELNETSMNESAATANRLIQKMSTTINDFRNFFNPDKEVVEFSALHQIKQAVLLVEAAFRNNRIDIAIDETQDCTLLGYPNEYSQVLLNLLTNAREAITGNHVIPGRIRISIRPEGGMGVVTVFDNGGGIPKHVLDKVFEPYFTTKSTGTGIGLYMSKMIIERNMHGRITVRNRQGGSEFSVSVPLVAKPE